MGVEHVADAPTAHRMILCLYFGAQPASAVALAVVDKHFTHGHASGRLGPGLLPMALPSVICVWGHQKHVAKLAHGHLGLALDNPL